MGTDLSADQSPSAFGELLDRVPNFGSLELPGFIPSGVLRFYSSPHFGDLLHRDYLRVPVGIRAKITREFELHTEVEGYFTHGLGDTDNGYGLDRLRFGGKYEPTPPDKTATAWSYGADFETPLSRPPIELSDGHRHFLPYIAATRPIVLDWRPAWKLTGYGSVGADVLAHSPLPVNFAFNQLHTNALSLAMGVAREWRCFTGTFTATYATSSLISDENGQVFSLRPSIQIPLTRLQGRHTRLTLILGGRTTWGPDGHELGASGSLRVEFHVRSHDKK